MDRNLAMVYGYRDHPALRGSFNALAAAVFGLDFEPWYRNGFWGRAYEPHSLVRDGQVVSNVSLNWINGSLAGQSRRYIQLGTVMTREDCRGLGYNRRLMEAVLGLEYDSDGVFLYANDSVLDYYPKFGFQPGKEYRYRLALDGGEKAARLVPMETPSDWGSFLGEIAGRKSMGLLQMDTPGLLMFYLSQDMKNSVFFLPELDAVAIAEADGGTLTLFDVYAGRQVKLTDVCRCFGPEVRQVEFAFTPGDVSGLDVYEYREDDTTLFIRGDGLARDLERLKGFPALAHA